MSALAPTRSVVAAIEETAVSSSASQLGRGTFVTGGMFSADALEANRAGRLTDVQRKQFGNIDRNWRSNEIVGAVGIGIIGLLLLSETGPAPNAAYRPLVGLVCFAIAIALAVHAMPSNDPLSGDLRSGQVQTIDGAIGKHSFSSGSHSGTGSSSSYFLDVADKRFTLTYAEYEALPSAGWMRVYYLPKSKRVVNVEKIEGPALPEYGQPTMDALLSTMKEVAHSRGDERREAMARIEQIGEAYRVERADERESLPTTPQDPGALSQQVIGTWRGGPITVRFDADGTVELTPMAGQPRKGHWSVDGQGRLHTDAMTGKDQAGQAWVQGDSLVIAQGKDGLRLQRLAQ